MFIWTPALSFTVKEHTNAEINDKYNEEQTGKLALCIGFSEHEQKKGNWSFYYKATYFTSSPTTQNGTIKTVLSVYNSQTHVPMAFD